MKRIGCSSTSSSKDLFSSLFMSRGSFKNKKLKPQSYNVPTAVTSCSSPSSLPDPQEDIFKIDLDEYIEKDNAENDDISEIPNLDHGLTVLYSNLITDCYEKSKIKSVVVEEPLAKTEKQSGDCCRIYVKLYPKLENVTDGCNILGPFTSVFFYFLH